MKLYEEKQGVRWVWALVVSCAFLGFFITALGFLPLGKALLKACLVMLFFVLIAQVQNKWLIPRFFHRRKLMPYILLSTMSIVLTAFLRWMLEKSLGVFPPEVRLDKQLSITFNQLMSLSFFLQHMLFTLFVVVMQLFQSWSEAKWRESQLETGKLQAELSLLRSQISPHFLFNTLNNLYALAYTHDSRTPEVVLKLADMMRYLVEESRKDQVPLKSELEFLKNYLDLQKLKGPHFDKIEFVYEELQGWHRVPPLLLLPFFENIFKHSDLERNPDGWAIVHLSQTPEYLRLYIENTFQEKVAKQAVPSEGGFGIENVKQRLQLLYGANYHLEYSRQEHWKVELEIPIEP